jgi:hypothetical protein
VVPRSPQDIIGRKDGCDEWNSAKALMRTGKSEYQMMARPGQSRSGPHRAVRLRGLRRWKRDRTRLLPSRTPHR